MTKPGRPKLPPGQTKSVQIGVRFSRVEMNQIKEACKQRKQSVVYFIRAACSQSVLALWLAHYEKLQVDVRRDIKIKRRNFGKWGNAVT